MKQVLKLFFVIITGILTVYVLNSSAISNINFGITLPIGWSENFVSNGPCPDIYISPKGLPFKDWRNQGCGSEINNLATATNYVIGASISVLAYIASRKFLAKTKN